MNHFDTPFQRWLEENEAHPHFREWVAGQSPQEFWATCEDSRYMLWLYRRSDPDKHTSVQLALAFAERVKVLLNKEGKECLRLVRKWIINPKSVIAHHLHYAAHYATIFPDDYSPDYPTSYATDAAVAAVDAIVFAAVDDAVIAAADAVIAAANADADAADAERKAQADIIRRHLPECPLVLRDLGAQGPKPTGQSHKHGYSPVLGDFAKADQGKARYALLPPLAIDGMATAMTHGASKYGDHNWRGCQDPARYLSAALRHIFAEVRQTGSADAESELLHIDHALASLAIYRDLLTCAHLPRTEAAQQKGGGGNE